MIMINMLRLTKTDLGIPANAGRLIEVICSDYAYPFMPDG